MAWYDHAIIYQLYPKSFQDSNGDGIGDLNGIRARIPYLKALGITAVWLNPVFTSPQVDNGYDVANYYAIDPTMGTMADMDALIAAFHAAGIHVILDFVLNHTSDQHPWFQDALRGADSLYRDYYIFAGHEGKRPSNWGSFFGGSVWAPDPSGSGQSYFHLFDRRMPDLNWANPEVRHAMGDVADYWLQKGVDGLRLDAFIHIAKAKLDQDFPDAVPAATPVLAEPFYANLPQVQTWLRPFCRRLKTDYPDVFLLGEAASANVNLAAAYTAPDAGLMDSVVTFRYFPDDLSGLDPQLPTQYQEHPLDLPAFKQTQAVWQQTLAGLAQPTLYWSNHDMPRLGTRVAHSAQQAQSLAMLMYLQRGLPIIYYGEELGLTNLQLPDAAAFGDPTVTAFVTEATAAGMTPEAAVKLVSTTHKLPARGPMPWDDGAQRGFTTGTPWLTGAAAPVASVAAQAADPTSSLAFYQQLIALKKRPLFQDGDYHLLTTAETSYVYTRQLGSALAVVAVALGATTTVTLPQGHYHALLTSGAVHLAGPQLTLGEDAGVVLIREGAIE
ncbi:glycoside hydrolase family 13 protein [Lacticaseibacillus daqingensis]|uniref:glycoside hydrolase family 13 protein n=1 Tax=Lacticaseibacillus daqingensis TaxID=2486014 RepID=UPI000F7817E6|nr:alpha-glucosidase [Lacticaseibacillus daqingensis]